MFENWENLMDKVSNEYRQILGGKLTGIYIHGSIVFNCFNPDISDIDFIVVVENPLSQEEKERMIAVLLRLSPYAPEKGLEMSAVMRKYCKNFVYPTPYELHFSNFHKAAYERDLGGYCKTLCGTDPDLAAHFTVINHVGIVWEGEPISEVFGEVPKEAYFDSIKYDIENAEEQIIENPVYIILNLCRVLEYKLDGAVVSKKVGGEWGIVNLPEKYAGLIELALSKYLPDSTGNSYSYKSEFDILLQDNLNFDKSNFDKSICADFCKYMSKRIFN